MFVLGLAACGGEHSRNSNGGPTGSADSENKMPIPRMEARGMFFDGQVEAEALLARAGTYWARDNESGGTSTAGQQSSDGGMGRGGGHGGGHRGGGRGADPGGNADGGSPQTPPIHAINHPAIELRLRLTNHGNAPITIEVVDFNSDLGDFVVLPEKIAVLPRKSVEADPMVSRLGVYATEIPLTVKLKIDGRSDQQVLTLKIVKEAAPASAPQPAGPSAQASPAPPSP